MINNIFNFKKEQNLNLPWRATMSDCILHSDGVIEPLEKNISSKSLTISELNFIPWKELLPDRKEYFKK